LTDRQGQYLAFIYAYSCVNGRPPAEVDMQRYFQVGAATVHQAESTWHALASSGGSAEWCEASK
jgi:hypothetical protein